MRIFAVLALLVLTAFPAAAQDNKVSIRLIADRGEITAGDTVTIGIEQTIAPHWHTYWLNPGDSGTAPRIAWTLPDDFKTHDIQWPVPKKLPFGPMVNFGYEDSAVLLQDITVPDNFGGGPLTLQADIDILVCNEICIPETHSASLTFNNGAAGSSSAMARARATLPIDMGWEAKMSAREGTFVTSIAADGLDGFLKNKNIDILPEEWGLIKNTAESTVILDEDGKGLDIHKEIGERALADVAVTKALITYDAQDGTRRGVRISVLNPAASAAATQTDAPMNAMPLWLVGLLALLGGLILNLMPCVFPVLSMKALSLASMKDKDIGKARRHGLSYAAGVIGSFVLIAAILIALKGAGAQIGWGFQLQSPLIILILAYLLFLIGLNLSGFFEFSGRFANIGQSLTAKAGYGGSFFTGVLATLVATPCTAPFMGVAMGVALTLPPPAALSIFVALGAGLALPYVLLCFVPALRNLLPHPGPWMETFRQCLSFPMFASASWLVWVLAQQADPMAVLSALLGMVAIAFVLWLYKVRPARGAPRILTFILALTALGFVLSTMIFPHPEGMAQKSPQEFAAARHWEDFTQERLDALLADGFPVFVNMTAAWCITCKVNEKVALNTDATRALFAEKGIRYIKGDWTNQNPEITQYLAHHGRSGVPIYVYYGPRNEATGQRPDPVILPQLLTPGIVRDTIL